MITIKQSKQEIQIMLEDVTRRVLKSPPHFPAHWGPDHVRGCVWMAINRQFLDLQQAIREIRRSEVKLKMYL